MENRDIRIAWLPASKLVSWSILTGVSTLASGVVPTDRSASTTVLRELWILLARMRL